MNEIAVYVLRVLGEILPCGKPIWITITGNHISFLAEWKGKNVACLRIEREITLDGDYADAIYFGMKMAEDMRFLEKLDGNPTSLESAFEFDPNQDILPAVPPGSLGAGGADGVNPDAS